MRGFLFLSGLLAISLIGCGVNTYNNRVEQTSKWYAYREKVETSLAVEWKTFGMSLRVPLQFAPIPGPVLKKGQAPEEVPDPREPDYINLKLNDWGLQGAWEARFEVPVGADGRKLENRKGYIYVLNNMSRLAHQSAEVQKHALEYDREAMTAILDEFKIPDELRRMVREQHPSAISYVPMKEYEVANLRPTQLIEGVPYRVDLYYIKVKNVQTLFMVVLPDRISPTESVPERIGLMLENSKITGEQMQPGSNKKSGPSAPPIGF